MEKRISISVSDAMARVMRHAGPGTTETVDLDQSLGRFLAQDAQAREDIPPFNRAAFDGYALRAADTIGAGHQHSQIFEIVEDVPAGTNAARPVGAFQAARIMTGAPIPSDCDGVVMLEWTEEYVEDGKRRMLLRHAIGSGDNISFQGEEASSGDVLISQGYPVHPGTVALLAALGYPQVLVSRKPLVGVMTTGSELMQIHEPLKAGMIRNSNASMIHAQIQRAGGLCKDYGTIPDDFMECLKTVKAMLAETDILISTGGVSVGDFDYMPQVYQELGATVLFNKIDMRPGSVTTVAELDGKLLFGLSGNPSACFIGFELFARPVIRAWLHAEKPYLPKVQAVLQEDFLKPNPFTRFVRAKTVIQGGQLQACPTGLDKSSAVISLAGANSMIVLPGGSRGHRKGSIVDVFLLDDQEGSDWPWEDDPHGKEGNS